MKQLIIDKENPQGRVIEVEMPEAESEAEAAEPIKAFFEGLASTDTNSIAKIRELAKAFLENTAEGK